MKLSIILLLQEWALTFCTYSHWLSFIECKQKIDCELYEPYTQKKTLHLVFFMFTFYNICFHYPHDSHTLATFQKPDSGPRTCKLHSQQVDMLI